MNQAVINPSNAESRKWSIDPITVVFPHYAIVNISSKSNISVFVLSPGPCQLNAGLEMVQVTFTERHEVYTFSQNITNMTNMQQVTLLPEQIPMLEPQEGHLRSWTSPGGLLTGTSTRALLLPSFLGCLLLSPQRLRIQNSDPSYPTLLSSYTVWFIL